MGLRLSPPHKTKKIKILGGDKRIYPTNCLYGEVNSRKQSTMFLGMTLDKKLDWKAHIITLKGETLRTLNVLRVISRVKFGPDRKTLLSLYWALGESKIDYGPQQELWRP